MYSHLRSRGAVVLEVALLVAFIGTIATLSQLKSEVAQERARAQYAAAEAGAAGGAGKELGAGGDQKKCVNGESYEVVVEADIPSGQKTTAQFVQTTKPKPYIGDNPVEDCSLRFCGIDGTCYTVKVPPGGDLDKEFDSKSGLPGATARWEDAKRGLRDAVFSQDPEKINTATNKLLVDGVGYQKAVRAAFGEDSNEYKAAAAGVSAANELGEQLTVIAKDSTLPTDGGTQQMDEMFAVQKRVSAELMKKALGEPQNFVRLADAGKEAPGGGVIEHPDTSGDNKEGGGKQGSTFYDAFGTGHASEEAAKGADDVFLDKAGKANEAFAAQKKYEDALAYQANCSNIQYMWDDGCKKGAVDKALAQRDAAYKKLTVSGNPTTVGPEVYDCRDGKCGYYRWDEGKRDFIPVDEDAMKDAAALAKPQLDRELLSRYKLAEDAYQKCFSQGYVVIRMVGCSEENKERHDLASKVDAAGLGKKRGLEFGFAKPLIEGYKAIPDPFAESHEEGDAPAKTNTPPGAAAPVTENTPPAATPTPTSNESGAPQGGGRLGAESARDQKFVEGEAMGDAMQAMREIRDRIASDPNATTKQWEDAQDALERYLGNPTKENLKKAIDIEAARLGGSASPEEYGSLGRLKLAGDKLAAFEKSAAEPEKRKADETKRTTTTNTPPPNIPPPNIPPPSNQPPNNQGPGNPLSNLLSGLQKAMGGQQKQGGAKGGGGSGGQQNPNTAACTQWPGTTLQNGQCTCPTGQSWNGSACAQQNVCAQYPGTTLVNNQCTCPQGQNWTGAKCEDVGGTATSTLKAQLACSPQAQEPGEKIALSYSCTDASTIRADGFTITGNRMSGELEVVATTTDATDGRMKFALTCAKEGKIEEARCEVTVSKAFIVLVATPSTVESGKPTKIGWITGGMKASDDACSLKRKGTSDVLKQGRSSVYETPGITGETMYVLSCTTAAGFSKTAEVTVKVR